MDGVDDFGVVDALEIDGGDAEVAVAELALDYEQRDAFVGHLDVVGVPELVRGKAAPHSSFGRSPAQVSPGGRVRPVSPACRSGDDAKQRPDRKLETCLEPRLQLLPAPASMPTSRRRPPLPWRTSSDPRRSSRSASPSESASWIRSELRVARHLSALPLIAQRSGGIWGGHPTAPIRSGAGVRSGVVLRRGETAMMGVCRRFPSPVAATAGRSAMR